MSGQSEGDGETIQVAIISPDDTKQEDAHGTLLVAMQPGVEIPAIGGEEVVVMTEGDSATVVDHVETTIGEHTVEESALIPLGVVEDVVEDIKPFMERRVEKYEPDDGSYARRSMVYHRTGVKASKAPPPESSGESDSESDTPNVLSMYQHTPTKKTPKKRDFAYRLQWRSKDMLDAMKAVEEKKMTIRGAAKKYLVPYSTLKDRVHGRVRHGTKPGVKTALSPEEEEELVRYIKDMEAAGFHLRNCDLRERAGELLRLNYGHSSPYGEGSSPGHNWLSGFLKRHQGIEIKRHFTRALVPSCSRQRQLVKKFFDVTAQVYKKNRLQTKPERIYVVSEMKMSVFQKASIIYSASAAGNAIPPFVIFKGQQKLKLTSAREAYPQAFFTSDPSGAVTEEIFLWWFRDHFLKTVPHTGNRPLVLFISQPCMNISLQMYQLAKEERVIFISIPQGVAHLLQPLDDELGDYIENCITKKVTKWESVNSGSIFNQKVLAQILQKVWKKVFTLEEVSAKYNKVGIYPLNPSVISTDKILAMSHAIRENMRQTQSSPGGNDEDDAAQGLSLLSALSSHEYVSGGNTSYGSQDNLNQSLEEDVALGGGGVKRSLEHTPTTSPPNKRPRILMEEVTHQDVLNRDMEPIVEQVVNRVNLERSKGASTSAVAIKQENSLLLDDGSTIKTDKSQESGMDVQSEIALARENLDQINRAVDSILSTEATVSQDVAVTENKRERRASKKLSPMRATTKSNPVRVNPAAAAAAAAASRKSVNVASSVMPPKATVKVEKPTKKIIFMLNKQGQLVSRTEVEEPAAPQVHEAGDGSIVVTTTENVHEEVVEDIYSNIKMEEVAVTTTTTLVDDSANQLSNIYTTPDSSYISAGGTEIDEGFSIANRVEEQPPQHILQDEELDLETVDTILINGQLFRVIRPQQDENVATIKHEEFVEAGRASVVHQEVVQDYEVSSFEQVGTETVIEEQVLV